MIEQTAMFPGDDTKRGRGPTVDIDWWAVGKVTDGEPVNVRLMALVRRFGGTTTWWYRLKLRTNMAGQRAVIGGEFRLAVMAEVPCTNPRALDKQTIDMFQEE